MSSRIAMCSQLGLLYSLYFAVKGSTKRQDDKDGQGTNTVYALTEIRYKKFVKH